MKVNIIKVDPSYFCGGVYYYSTGETQDDAASNKWWGYWVGFNDIANEGVFVWTDGTQVSIKICEVIKQNESEVGSDMLLVSVYF